MTPSKETNDFPIVSLDASASGMGAVETFLSLMLLTAEWDLSSPASEPYLQKDHDHNKTELIPSACNSR